MVHTAWTKHLQWPSALPYHKSVCFSVVVQLCNIIMSCEKYTCVMLHISFSLHWRKNFAHISHNTGQSRHQLLNVATFWDTAPTPHRKLLNCQTRLAKSDTDKQTEEAESSLELRPVEKTTAIIVDSLKRCLQTAQSSSCHYAWVDDALQLER